MTPHELARFGSRLREVGTDARGSRRLRAAADPLWIISRNDGWVQRFPGFGLAAGMVAVYVVLGGCTAQTGSDDKSSSAGASRPDLPTAQADLDEALRERRVGWRRRDRPQARVPGSGCRRGGSGTQQSAYLVATSEGHLDLLELALEAGADVDAEDSWNGTGLILVAERGHHQSSGGCSWQASTIRRQPDRLPGGARGRVVRGGCEIRARHGAGARGGWGPARPSLRCRKA